MFSDDKASQALDDIYKVFILYERNIIDAGTVKDLTNRITDLYVTKTVLPKPTGQSCKTCLYYDDTNHCFENENQPSIDPNGCCDRWYPGINSANNKE